MRSALQQSLIVGLSQILRPIISLCLRCGIGFSEFRSIARNTFVAVASEEYGLRGRPTNVSRVAAMTGISRKEIRRIRQAVKNDRWTPAMESSPANLLLHYWRYDPSFYEIPGRAAMLPLTGDASFSSLARRYAGDIPIGAMKEELKRAGVITESDGSVSVRKNYFQPEKLDEDFIRNITFSIKSLASTVVYNAMLVTRDDFSQELNEKEGRFERFAWTDQLSAPSRAAFRQWVRQEGAKFIERADDWIGKNERAKESWKAEDAQSLGVGLYFFEED